MSSDENAPDAERKDGFRKRRNTRPKGWQEKAIKSGQIADPKVGPQPHQTYSADQTVIEPEVATLSASGDET